jgi:ABC-2 type transport system ATP-binding protein
VIDRAHLTTWSVSGPDLLKLAEKLHNRPGIQQVIAFGNMLHISGEDATSLEQTIAPFRTEPYQWRQVDSGVEDVFIRLMSDRRTVFHNEKDE